MSDLGRQLTEKERVVYCALIKYPTKNDRELSDITGINLSTVTAIRRRLETQKIFYKVRLPMVQHLGAELLTISYGALDTSVPKKKKDELCTLYAKDHDDVFLMYSSDDFAVQVGISRNYTDVKRNVDDLERFLSMNKLLTGKGWHYIIFPFEVSSLINFFDFSYAMSHLVCGSPYKIPEIDLRYRKYERKTFTSKERAAFMGLVLNPTMPDNAIAAKAGVSRQTLSNMHQRFHEEGLLHEINVPDLTFINGILIFSHMLFNPDCMLEDRKAGVKMVLESSPAVFVVSGSFESCLMHIVSNYDDYNMYKNKIISYYASKKFLRGEGAIHLMPVKSLSIHKHFDFGGMLKNLMA